MRDFTTFLKSYFAGKKDLSGAEIGVYRGENADELYREVVPATFILVDCWTPKGLGFEVDDKGESAEGFLNTYSLHKDRERVTIIKGWSLEVARFFRDELFNFIYIDGNHCLEQCRADLWAWYPKVKSKGVFGGHDFNMDGVRQAVEEFFNGSIITGRGVSGVDWWIVKP